MEDDRKPHAQTEPGDEIERAWDRAPSSPRGLHRWLRAHLDLTIPVRPIIRGHAAPFDYLVHTYFGGSYERCIETEPAPAQPESGAGRHQFPAFRRVPPASALPDCVVWANRGGGKTFLGAVATLLDLVFFPGIEVRLLAGSLEQAGRMHEHLRALLAREAFVPLVSGRVTERRVRLVNGSRAEVLAQSQPAVRGTRVQKLRCDEVELFRPEIWEAAQLTTRSGTFGGRPVRGAIECLSTMHRPFGLMADFVERAIPPGVSPDPAAHTRRLFRWGVVDVLERCGPAHRCRASDEGSDGHDCAMLEECAGHAKRTRRAHEGHVRVVDALGQKGRASEASWSSEMLCLAPARSDSVYPEFDAGAHLIDREPPPNTDGLAPSQLWIAGMDFGFRGLTVVLFASVTTDGVLRVIDERAASESVLRAHIDAVLRGASTDHGDAGPPAWIGVDPAGMQRSDQTGKSNIQMMREAGLTVRAARLTTHTGIGLVRARLAPASGPPRLLVHRRCRVLIEALRRYHYDPASPETGEPVKDGPDHACDALRYLVQNLDRPHTARTGNYAR